MHISEWIEKGQPANTWFVIVRQESIDDMTQDTPEILSRLILKTLKSYGKFETREYETVFDNYYFYEYNGHRFLLTYGTGNINGENVPVIMACIDARILSNE